MRIVFCDDAPDELKQIKKLVKQFFAEKDNIDVEYVEYNSGDTLLQHETSVDLAFLDVEMCGQTGLQVASKLKKNNPHTKAFIVTAHRDYIDDAMELELYHFFEKPVNKDRLYRRLSAAVKLYFNDTVPIIIETPEGLVKTLQSREIVYVKAESRHCIMHTTTNCYKIRSTFDQMAKKLDLLSFVCPGRGELVNLAYTTGFDRSFIYLTVLDKRFKVYLTRRKYTEVKQAYLQYVEATR